MACFTITGEFLTEQARTFWQDDGEPTRALRLLRELDGISLEQCLDILEGRAKLIGKSSDKGGVGLAADNVKDLPTLDSVFAKLEKERDAARSDVADLLQIINKDVVTVASPTGRRLVPRRQTVSNGSTSCIAGTLREGLSWDGTEEGPGLGSTSASTKTGTGGTDATNVGRYLGRGITVEELPEPERPVPKPDATITSATVGSPPTAILRLSVRGHNQVAWDLDLEHDELAPRTG
jgi:hypothetical protein